MTPRPPLAVASLLIALGACAMPPRPPLELPEADPERGRLLVFTSAARSEPMAVFAEQTLPELEALAEELGVRVDRVDVTGGVPAEVGIVPLLVYQNHRGRSVFQGRFDDLERARTFLRTARRVPQGAAPLELSDVPTLRVGRSRVWSPIKVAPVTGTPPADHDAQAFQAEARAAVARGLSRYAWPEKVELGRSERGFYMDFYPWRADDGTLYLSTALYSQFHCKTPIFTTPPDAPFVGPWEQRERLFREAAADLQQRVLEAVGSAANGDGFVPLSQSVAAPSWEALGLGLPDPPAGLATPSLDAELARRWELHPDPELPELVFHFPAPLDHYRGEVTRVRATLDLGPARDLVGAEGAVEVDATSVTMGEPSLDGWIHGPEVLRAAEHPTPGFVLEELEVLGPPPGWGRLTSLVGRGRFDMRGASTPVEVAAQLEPSVTDDGQPELLVRGSFTLPLGAPFGIPVPVGEPPTNRLLVFELDFRLRPADG